MREMPHISSVDEQKIESLAACPSCSSNNNELLFKEKGYGYYLCECELIFLNPRIKEKDVGFIYEGSAYHSYINSDYQSIIAKKRLELFPNLNEGDRLHEDGASNGFFLQYAKTRNLNCTGSDISQEASEAAKKTYGVDVQAAALEKVQLPPKSLNALASFNVLCHVYRPWEYLKACYDLLDDGGYLLLRTGDRNSYFRKVQQGNWSAPEHVYHFSYSYLKKELSSLGFKEIKKIPAFDSDYPYFLFDSAQKGNPLAKFICQNTIRLWNLLKLPKDDIYILCKK